MHRSGSVSEPDITNVGKALPWLCFRCQVELRNLTSFLP